MKVQTLWTMQSHVSLHIALEDSPLGPGTDRQQSNDTAAAANPQWVLVMWTGCACEKTLTVLPNTVHVIHSALSEGLL